MSKDDPGVLIKCPNCDRDMGKVRDIGRLVCQRCGSEVTYRSREAQTYPLTRLPNGAILEVK